jgi:uncharacterized MAPEG superfamily protein
VCFLQFYCPYIWAGIAKFTSGFLPRDNHNPREYLEKLQGLAKRAHCAQLNTFESIPGFMAAVIIAQLAHAALAGLVCRSCLCGGAICRCRGMNAW